MAAVRSRISTASASWTESRSPRAFSWPRNGPATEGSFTRQKSWPRQAFQGGTREMDLQADVAAPARAREFDVQTGSTERPEVRIVPPSAAAPRQLRSRHRSRGNSSEGIVSEGSETQPGRGGSLEGPSGAEHRDAEIESVGRSGIEEENPMALLPPRPPDRTGWNGENRGHQPPAQFPEPQNLLAAATSRGGGVPEPDGRDSIVAVGEQWESSNREVTGGVPAAEEMKGDLKLCYFATGVAGAGIISVYSGYLGNQAEEIKIHHLKTCTFLMMAAFMSGASLMLLTYPRPCLWVPIEIIKTLKYTTLGYLTLAVLEICHLFLKIYVLLAVVVAFVPTLVVFVCLFIRARCRTRRSRLQASSSIQLGQFARLSSVL